MQCPNCGTWYAEAQAFCFTCGNILMDGKNKARVGNYRLLNKIGQGGMGIVYHGIDESLQRDVAIKVLHQHMLSNPKQVDRFRREARMQGQLMHPNVVALLDVYEDENILALVLELVKGCTLKEYLTNRGIPKWPEIRYIAEGILSGLEAAHERGVIHRDLKPSNVFLNDDGIVKLMDFGLARTKKEDEDITSSGDTVGTYHYMAPEQIVGQEIDARADLYSLGILLYRMCTNELPFTASGGGEFEIMEKQVRQQAVPPRELNRKIPKALAETIEILMQKNPEDRPKNCKAVLAMLEPLAGPELPKMPKNEKGKTFSSFSQMAITPTGRGMKALSDGQDEDIGTDSGMTTPSNCLLWAFRVGSAKAPETPPVDLRSPPAIEPATLSRLREAIKSFPALPDIWHDVQKIRKDHGASSYDLAQAINTCPTVGETIMRFAGDETGAGSGGQTVAGLALAITHMGIETAHDLALQAMIPNLGGKDASDEEVRLIWLHVLCVAHIARTLSEHAKVVNSYSASLFALLHDIGKLVMLALESSEATGKIRDAIRSGKPGLEAEWDTLGYTHIDAGMMLALHWNLPRTIHRFVYFHHHPCWHPPDTWPMDVQPAIMLNHMAHLVLQSIMTDEDRDSGIWSADRRTHIESTENLLRHPLQLPLADTALYTQIRQDIDRLKRRFPEIYSD